MTEINIELSDKQNYAWGVLGDPSVQSVLYGGAKGGGKSYFGCLWVYANAEKLIKQCNIEEQKFPIPIAYMGRKRGVDFGDTTLETWKKVIPSSAYEIRIQDKEIIIRNRVKIIFGGFDNELQVKKFNSAEYVFYFIDQAEEISRDEIGLLRGTLRLTINGVVPEYKGLLTANPAPCWLRDEFILNPPKDGSKVFIQALPKDNPYLPESYINTLRDAFKHRPELIKAYVEGSWDELEGADIVIQYSWVKQAVKKKINGDEHKHIIVCDPARFGDDETVIYAMHDGRVIAEEIYGKKSTMETAGHCIAMLRKHDANLIVIDSIGVGSGIADRLRELHEPVYEINSAASPDDKEKFANIRAEMWWLAGKKFYDGVCSLPDDPILLGQLSGVKYKIKSNGRIAIESKEDIKKRIGNSPDRADAVVMGLYGLRQASSTKKMDRWYSPPVREMDPMTA